ncbi:DUF6884 domain-containing protein [Archangium lansingense]|uniref:DUF6884 domain-containing protein n=1 Tax=Archangium lansingense TaxID=2995310 RepID=A0ABT4AF77_9BACT|nr:DUF6884 domain-containing protein [Archangium lansinium]MCY1080315.1 hypothetical protein [Archangium lansinium]
MTAFQRRYALVGCGKSKLDRAAPARELYTGPLFRAALEVAESEFGQDVWILSAKYRLTDPNEGLEPYDLHLEDLPPKERADWARDVIRNLVDDDEGTPAHLTVYAGSTYVDELRAHLPNTWTLVDPMKGLGQGERLAWLKARRAALINTPSAGPSASPLELSMSTAIPTTLNHEQRSTAFNQALVLEDGLKELEALKARLLAGLEAQADVMRQSHARLMRAATTGVSPESPEQQALPLDGMAPAASVQAQAAEVSPKEDEPPPEPPKGKGRRRSRAASSAATGTKRTGPAASARTASAQQASARQATELDDAVPAPRIPCCDCGHSVADHQDGTGRCGGKAKGRRCRCKRFTAVAVELPGAPGWKVRPFKGQLSIGKGGDQGCILVGGKDETPPLYWVPGYGLAFQNGEAVSAVVSHLGDKATTLAYEQDPRWHWVPKAVLRAVAEYLGATWPEPSGEDSAPEALPRMEATTDHPCECDGCGETFKAAELQPVGEEDARGFYCPKCKAEVEEQDGEKDAPTAQAERDVPELDDPFVVPSTDGAADPSFSDLDLSSMEQLLGKPRIGHSTFLVKVHGSSPRACEACGTRERPRAWISINRDDRASKRGAIVGGGGFGLALCVEHATEEGGRLSMDNRRRVLLDQTTGAAAFEPRGLLKDMDLSRLPDAREVEAFMRGMPEANAAGEWMRGLVLTINDAIDDESWEYLPGFGGWRVIREIVDGWEHAWLSFDLHATATMGPWVLDEDKRTLERAETFSYPNRWFNQAGKPMSSKNAHEWEQRTAFAREMEVAMGRVLLPELFPPSGGGGGQTARDGAGPAAEAPAAPVGKVQQPGAERWQLTQWKGTTWSFGLGQGRGLEIDVWVEKATKRKGAELFGPASWSLAIEGWTGAAFPEGVPGEVVKMLVRELRAEDSPAREAVQRGAARQLSDSSASSAAATSTWRVELPERNEGHVILRLWLVNDTTGERKPATWRSGMSALRRSHHLAGTLEGEALQAERELEVWWMVHADDVVAPLAQACRDGKVSGLKVYDPDAFGSGPHKYALSNGWTLEAWEGEGSEGDQDEEPALIHFTRPTQRSDVWERFGPFVLNPQGHLTTANAEASEWSAEHEAVVAEAEDFVRRGFVFELRQEVAS